ncbi:GAF domain-containing protein [Paenibacillus melissococcoides]|uniref:GAF domain-containing protein n=1 Tax=Paenibacillus melissococcoides TaxID=2912268 RepID=UPI0038B2D34A
MTNESSSQPTLQQQVQRELEELKRDMGLDFVAVALADGKYRDIYWRFALGANSERYKMITVRMGRGMAGKVLQGKRPHVVTAFPEEVRDEVLEYPIFLVESLRSGVGVSVDSIADVRRKAYGVLLVGQRSPREFSAHDIERVQSCARTLGRFYDEEDARRLRCGRMDPPASENPLPTQAEPNGSQSAERSETPAEPSDHGQDREPARQAAGPILRLLKAARSAGVACELLDQRVTRLSLERQEQFAAILEVLVNTCVSSSPVNAQLVIGQEETGNTRVEFNSFLLHALSQELFLPVMEQIRSLKCDFEIVTKKSTQSVRFIVPTRLLLDEMHWN